MLSPIITRKRSYQQAVLKGTLLDMAKQVDFIDAEAFVKGTHDQKLLTIISSLNKLHVKFDGVYEDIHNEKEGINAKLNEITETVENLVTEGEQHNFEIKMLRGVVARQEQTN